jgi:50S ribosomal protein L16 3-hydroxylase
MGDEEFWSRFHETIWERKPAHLGHAITPLLNRDEVFTLGVTVGEALGRGDPLRIRWCDDGKRTELLEPNLRSAALLPQRSDRNLDGYCRRMSKLETFFFRIPEVQLLHPALWPRLVRLTRNLYPKTGVPGQMAWSDAYFGRYTATPFGVHLDGASNFTFGIDGYKTLYLWEPEFFEANMKGAGVHDYQPFVPRATKLTVGPGELIYWPGRYYHIAVPDGVFSVTVNFAFYAQESQGAWLERAFSDVIADIETQQSPFHASTLPRDLAELCRSTVAKVASGALERQLLKRVVEHRTRLGFYDAPPPRASVSFEVGDRVVLTPDCELVSVPDGSGSVIVSANGHSIVLPDVEKLQATMKVLESGQPLVVDAETKTLTEELFRWAAVERYWA